MADLKYTPVGDIEKIHATVYQTFKSGTCRPLAWRRKQLYALARLCQENIDVLADALYKDIGKPRHEAAAGEVVGLISRALDCAKELEEWAKPEVVTEGLPEFQKAMKPTINKTPKGPALIITPWNFPLVLTGTPLMACMASGNPAVIKPSEISANLSKVLAELVPKYLDPNAYVVVNGAVKETSKLLEMKWAHIHYTGNGRVARIIAAAAAKHLTPLSLELGGKSPVIIDPSYDVDLAAKRILCGKHMNAGQICLAPDFVLVTKGHQATFIEALRKQLAIFHPEGSLKSNSFGRIVSPTHFARLKGLLDRTKGKIVAGGETDEKSLKIALTIVADVTSDDSLMSEELFGPILPIIPVNDLDEAIDFVNARDHPLELYVFTEDPIFKQRIVDETISGGLRFNNVVVGTLKGLPLAGVGESGYGYQGWKYGFEDFTHLRGTVDVPKEAEQFLSLRYPPYTEETTNAILAAAHKPIPTE